MSVVGNIEEIVVNGGSGVAGTAAPGTLILPLTIGGSLPSSFLDVTSLGISSWEPITPTKNPYIN